MKIETTLKFNTRIYMVVIVAMVLTLSWLFFEYQRTVRNHNLVLEMRNIAFERITLRDDYLLYKEERASIQWKVKSEELRGLLETAAGQFTISEDKALLREARKNFDATFSMFSAILEKYKQENSRSNIKFAFDESESRQIRQVFLNSYTLMDNFERLNQSTERSMNAVQNRVVFMLIFFFMAGGMVIVFNSVFLSRTLAKRLKALNEGVGLIGVGSLDYHIVEEGDDELSDLAHASNKMVARLKQSYISVKNLGQEITERQRVEEKLSRTNRVLAVISQINQIVMRTHEQNKLFAEVCRIAIEYGKFRMAWVGLIDEQEHTVKPINWDGFEEGYLTKIKKISTNDIPEGRGPTGTAAREGKFFYCNDIAKDPIMALWREDALQRGYRSSIALPISLQNRVIGVFTIYDVDPFFFNEAEIKLLNEVTDNINYALEIMEIEKKRYQAEDDIKLLNKELEGRVMERTAELSVRTAELERINKVFVGRELRMIELKKQIAELEKK